MVPVHDYWELFMTFIDGDFTVNVIMSLFKMAGKNWSYLVYEMNSL